MQSNNVGTRILPDHHGIAFMALAMLLIPLVDGTAKYLSETYSPFFISWARYAVASCLVLPLAIWLYGWRMFPREHLGAHFMRTLFLVAAMTSYFLAISEIPLALALSAYFVGPIIAVILSVLLFRERLTLRKTASLALGMAGALIILQPAGGMERGILLAFAAGFLFALYLIATRRASQHSDPVRTLVFQCIVGTVLLSPQAVATAALPTSGTLLFFLALGFISSFCHLLTIFAFRWSDASTLAPLVYVELVGTALVGYLAFAELPSPATIAGAALIVAGGLVLVVRR